MKNSTKTLIFSGAAIVAILIGMTIFISVKSKSLFKGNKTTNTYVECCHDFTSANVDSLAFDFPDYGHTRITVVPGQTDSIIFNSVELADQITVSRDKNTIQISTIPNFEAYLLTDITVTLKHIPSSIYTNGVKLLMLKNITADSLELNIKQNVSFEKCRIDSTDIRLASNYGSSCIISGTDSSLGLTRLTTIEPVYVTNGVAFEHLTLVGNQVKGGKKAYANREDILCGGPLILFGGKVPPIKIEESEYPFGVYIDGPFEIK